MFEVKGSEPQQEGKDILTKCSDMPVFAFSEEGNEFDSLGFADFLKGLSGDIAFVLGGPDGLSREVKDRAKMLRWLRADILRGPSGPRAFYGALQRNLLELQRFALQANKSDVRR